MSTQSADLLETGCWEVIEPTAVFSTATRARKWFIDLIKPSCIKKSYSSAEKPRHTAYLDGVRGFAALLVYWGHHELWAHDALGPDRILENAYGYDNQNYLACLPGVRLFFSGGHFAVTVFFVLSGYVLSTKPMAMIHAGEYMRLGDSLTSALFRRWLRLYLPVICTTFLYMSSWHLFRYRADPEPKPTYREELWNWYAEFKNFSFVFRAGGDPWFSYSFHTWSIPVEFRGSIVVYTALQAFSRSARNARLWCEIGLILYFMYIVDGSFCALFVAGMLLCDLDLLERAGDLPHFFSSSAKFQTYIFYGLFIISLYLGGSPAYSSDIHVLRESPGWYYLSLFKPQAVFDYKWFYLFWASTFFVASVQRITWLKAFFETRYNQYLGRISFAFYLVHGPILWSVGDRLYAAVGWTKDSQAVNIPGWINILPLPKIGPFGLELSFLLPHVILLPLTLWVAEMATTLIDEPSVRFSQWLYIQTLAPTAKL